MTASFQTSFFSPIENSNSNRPTRRSDRNVLRIYQVDIENFDNEVESFEVEARSASEAAEKAEEMFGSDIYNMNVYEMAY